MALRIQGNQNNRNRYREIVACTLEEKKEHCSRNRENVAPEKSLPSKGEVQ
ncbi:MAG: hypothetical protein ABDK93_04505 [Atribacterota bacterium]